MWLINHFEFVWRCTYTVHDMFVLLRAYEMTPSTCSLSDRMKATMQHGGVSILYTSTTSLMVFAVGANLPIGGVRTLSIYCAFGIFLKFIFEITFFLGFMVYDSRYQQSHSVTDCCCGGSSDPKHTSTEQQQPKSPELHVQADGNSIETTVPSNTGIPGTGTPNDAPHTTSPIETPVSDSTSNQTSTTQNYMIPPEAVSDSMDNVGHFLMDSLWVKVLTFFAFLVYLAGAVVGILKIDIGTAFDSLVPKDSYLLDVYEANDRYFNVIGSPVQWMIDEDLDYSNNTVVKEIGNLMNSIWSDECFVTESSWTSSWIQEYSDYLDIHYGDDINQSAFYRILLDEFLVTDAGQAFTEDIWTTIAVTDNEDIDKSTYGSIRRSRFTVPAVSLGEYSQQYADCIDNLQRIQRQHADSLGLFPSKPNRIRI